MLIGITLAVAVAILARLAARFTGVVPDVALALLAGIAINNLTTLPASVRPGIKCVLQYVLRAAIILYGAGLTFAAVLQLGAATLLLVVVCVIVALSLGLLLARVTRLPGKVGTLIGAGTAICGGSAILAVGPLIEASDEEIAYAITTIFTFNIIALFAYPPLGHALHLSSIAFGSWAGTAVNDTSVVVATGYVYSQEAGATATIVKLTRTLLLVPMAFILGWAFARRRGGGAPSWSSLRKSIPWFVLGFAAMAGINSTGLLSPGWSHALTQVAGFLIVIVLAAVGLNVDFAKIRRMGMRPLAVGLVLALIMAVVSLSLVSALRIG